MPSEVADPVTRRDRVASVLPYPDQPLSEKGLTAISRHHSMDENPTRRPNFMLTSCALEAIFGRLEPGAIILEMGSGDGTTALIQHGFEVVSIEHDEAWANLHPGTCILAPIVPTPAATAAEESGWYGLDPEDPSLPEEIDLLLIDGPPGWIGRSGILDHPSLFERAKHILIDDTDRPAEQGLAERIFAMTNGSIEHVHSKQLNGRGLPRAFTWITPSR